MGMKKHSAKTLLTKSLVQLFIAVFLVTNNRVTCMLAVHTNLVGTPRQQLRIHQRSLPEALTHHEQGRRSLALTTDPDDTLARCQVELLQRRFNQMTLATPTPCQ